MRGRMNVSDKMIYKYGSIAGLVISGLIVLFGSWIRLTSEAVAMIRLGDFFLLDGAIDFIGAGSSSVYEHFKAGKLTLLDMHKALDTLGTFSSSFDGPDPFSVLGLLPLAAVIILVAVLIAEVVLRLTDKNVVFISAAAELVIWFITIIFVFFNNLGAEDALFRVSFVPVLAIALAVVSGVLWNTYKRTEAASPSFAGSTSEDWHMAPPSASKSNSDRGFYGYAPSPNPNGASFGESRGPAGAPNGMRHCPNCGAPLPSNSKFCGRCGSPVN